MLDGGIHSILSCLNRNVDSSCTVCIHDINVFTYMVCMQEGWTMLQCARTHFEI